MVLDEFRPSGRGGGRQAAFGPRLAAHVFSGNVPGVAVTSLVRSLLVKAATLGKTAVFSLPGSEHAVRLGMTKLILPEIGHVVRELRR